jgi:uncharacterized protein
MRKFTTDSSESVWLVHERTQRVIARQVHVALSRGARRQGLLGRSDIDAAAALVLAPCWTIHTAFMRFAIDVLFVDREGRALRVVHALKPWRAASSVRAYAAIELKAGIAKEYGVEIGDCLRLASAASASEC